MDVNPIIFPSHRNLQWLQAQDQLGNRKARNTKAGGPGNRKSGLNWPGGDHHDILQNKGWSAVTDNERQHKSDAA